MLVSAMHITAGVFVNDDESGLHADIWEWLEKLAPFREDYRHHRTGEDNGDAHLKSMLVHHEVIVPGHDGAARSRAVAARVLRGVRRAARQAPHREGDGRVRRRGGSSRARWRRPAARRGGRCARSTGTAAAADRGGAGARRRSSRRRRTRPSAGWPRPTRASRRARTRPAPDEVLRRIGTDAVLAEDTSAVIRGTSLDLFAFRARARALDEAAQRARRAPRRRCPRRGRWAARWRGRGSSGSCWRGSSPRSARAPTRRRSSATPRGSSCAAIVVDVDAAGEAAGRARTVTCGSRKHLLEIRDSLQRRAPRTGPPDLDVALYPLERLLAPTRVPAGAGGDRAGAHGASTRTCARCRSCGTARAHRARRRRCTSGVDARPGGAAGAARARSRRGCAIAAVQRARRTPGPTRGAGSRRGRASCCSSSGRARRCRTRACGRWRRRRSARPSAGCSTRSTEEARRAAAPGRAARRRAPLARGRRARHRRRAPACSRTPRTTTSTRSSDARASARSSPSAPALAAEILYGATGPSPSASQRGAPSARRRSTSSPASSALADSPSALARARREALLDEHVGHLVRRRLELLAALDDLGDRVVDAASSCRAPSSRRSRRPPARR